MITNFIEYLNYISSSWLPSIKYFIIINNIIK